MDSSSFAKAYAIIAITIVLLVFIGIFFRDIKNKKIKMEIRKEGCHTQAEILGLESYTGKISDYTNIKLHYKFSTTDGEVILGDGNAVVFTSDLQNYQVGKTFPITYSKSNPNNVIIEIENASLKRK